MTETTGAANCIFCKIVNGELGTQFVAENEQAVAFHDLSPQAPTHILIVPRRHLAALRDFGPDDSPILADLMSLAVTVARQEGLLDRGGYRLVTNDGPEAGQTVFHAHFHLLGGRSLAAMG